MEVKAFAMRIKNPIAKEIMSDLSNLAGATVWLMTKLAKDPELFEQMQYETGIYLKSKQSKKK